MDKKQLKEWGISRAKWFMSKAEETNDIYELESMFYALARVAEHTKDKFHEMHEKEQLPF